MLGSGGRSLRAGVRVVAVPGDASGYGNSTAAASLPLLTCTGSWGIGGTSGIALRNKLPRQPGSSAGRAHGCPDKQVGMAEVRSPSRIQPHSDNAICRVI